MTKKKTLMGTLEGSLKDMKGIMKDNAKEIRKQSKKR